MDFQTTINKILEILESCDQAIEIAQIVLMAVISHRCGATVKAVKTPSAAGAILPVNSTTSTAIPAGQAEEEKPVRTKKQLQDYITEGIALYFSGKAEEDMTEAEKAKYNAAKSFIEEV